MTFETVYTNQYKWVLDYCLWKLNDRADAEEITNEAFLQLFRSWERYDKKNECKGLLLQKARWLIANFYERKHKILFVPLHDGLTTAPRFKDPLPERLLDMIWKLPRLQRRSLVMYYFADMTYEEIASTMGTGTSTAEARTKAGIKKLRKAIVERT